MNTGQRKDGKPLKNKTDEELEEEKARLEEEKARIVACYRVAIDAINEEKKRRREKEGW